MYHNIGNNVKNAIVYVIAILQLFAILSCSSTKEVETIPVEERFQRAKALYDDGDYLEAITEFKIIATQYQGSEYSDDAQFYLAESRFNRGEYILAAAEYDNLARTMPSSPFAALSRYKKGLSNYLLSPKSQLDQKYTRQAIDDFQTYIEYSPHDTLVRDAEAKIDELTNKLAQKIFEAGKLYYRLEYYRAGIAYFDKVISEYNDRGFTDAAMLWKAKCQNERRDYAAAENTLSELLAKYPNTELKDEVKTLLFKIKNTQQKIVQEQQDTLSLKNE